MKREHEGNPPACNSMYHRKLNNASKQCSNNYSNYKCYTCGKNCLESN